ncbi:MAG: DUF1934 domain-containing protein [Lachnospiraceae bacterium]
MNVNSTVTISTIQYDVDRDTPVVITCPATHHIHNGKHYIAYHEEQDGQVTKNIIKIDETGMEVTKKGSIDSHMLYRQGVKNTTYYRHSYGSFRMEIFTNEIKQIETEPFIYCIKYDLTLNGSFVSKCEMTIRLEMEEDYDSSCRI